MRFSQLEAWLSWLETLHPSSIDLGLERVRTVAEQLRVLSPGVPVVMIAGTNGKGSTAALLEALLHAHGKRVGCYTSPHILCFNERIRIAGHTVTDDALLAALAAVDAARGDISLTYFEFTTLAALRLFGEADLDAWVLEVGLGGRLDAVNVIDPDVAVLTSVGLDHQAWLGDTREAIGYEKSGIFRAGCPAVVGDVEPPASVQAAIFACGAEGLLVNRDYAYAAPARPQDEASAGAYWSWRGRHAGASLILDHLPVPSLALGNAATALQAFCCLPFAVDVAAVRTALAQVRLPARNQRLRLGGRDVILDVGHNVDALRFLCGELPRHGLGMRFHVVIGMLDDKDVEAVMQVLEPLGQSWHIAPLPSPRSAAAARLHTALSAVGVTDITAYPGVAPALMAALAHADVLPVLVAGSFYTVATALQALGHAESEALC